MDLATVLLLVASKPRIYSRRGMEEAYQYSTSLALKRHDISTQSTDQNIALTYLQGSLGNVISCNTEEGNGRSGADLNKKRHMQSAHLTIPNIEHFKILRATSQETFGT